MHCALMHLGYYVQRERGREGAGVGQDEFIDLLRTSKVTCGISATCACLRQEFFAMRKATLFKRSEINQKFKKARPPEKSSLHGSRTEIL